MRRRWIVTTTTFFLLLLTLGATAYMQSASDSAVRRRNYDAAPGATTRIPLNNLQPVSNLSPEACANVIVDGGFENGGIPSSTWDPETSTNFGTPLCDNASCGTGGGASPPRTGLIWAWFGGIPAPETATLGQTVPIANNSTATLNFWMRVGTVSSPFTDVLNVRVDGTIVQSFPEPTVAEGAYTLRTINLNAFANGGNHAILFEYIGPSSGTGSYVIDDVSLDVCDVVAGGPPPGQKFTSSLNNAQETPAPTPLATLTGSGTGLVTLNAAENQITVALSYTGLGSNAIAGHIHGSATATPGNTAPIIFDLMPSGGTSGTNTATTFAITPAQVALLRSNLMYFNVHTVNNPNGEIRGQIHLNDSAANFDADGRTDASVIRNVGGNNVWYTLRSLDNATTQPTWDLATDTCTPGDFDGDGKADPAAFRNGQWFILRSSDGGTTGISWGNASDIPVPGDYDKDGKTDAAVFRPSTGDWFQLRSTAGPVGQNWGVNGDTAVPADYDGDGRTDLAVFRPSDTKWYILKSSGGIVQQQWGLANDKLAPADYDGDGKADIAVYRSSDSTFYILRSSNGALEVRVWGVPNTDIAVPGDYDSDGKADAAVFRPSEGRWYILRSFNNALQVITWGTNGDGPVPNVARVRPTTPPNP
ncbi:MAG: CHRD domain-containing protein [Pyrinomonadaceae bacterium]